MEKSGDSYMVIKCLLLLALAGCANGHPYEPCPTVVIYMAVDTTRTLATDSIDYTPECP